jgi:hypothetical protein
LEANPVELEPGTYWVQAVNSNDDILNFGEVEVEYGQLIACPHSPAGRMIRSSGDAMRTTTNFLIDLEMARLGFMGSASGGFTTTLFDPAVEPTAEDLQTLLDGMTGLARQEAALMAALRVIDDASRRRGRLCSTPMRALQHEARC